MSFFVLFLGFLYFEPNGLPRFRRICGSEAMTLVDGPFGTSIQIGTFTAEICDFVILFESVRLHLIYYVLQMDDLLDLLFTQRERGSK